MKKTILIGASILCLSACSLSNKFKNTPPTDIKVALTIGYSNQENGLIEVVDKDVYINTWQKDNYNNSYFAHFVGDSYVYYHKDDMNNGDWESFTPTATQSKNMTTLDAINSFVGTIRRVYFDVFNVELINDASASGKDIFLSAETTKYKVKEKTYWYLDGVNIFLKMENESQEERSYSVTDYQYYTHFDDSPSFQ